MKIKKIICIAVACLMIASLSACSKSEAGSSKSSQSSSEESSKANGDYSLLTDGVLSVGVEIGYPPFEDFAEDGTTPVGYDIDFAKALAEKLGLEVKFINTAWDGIFQGIDVNYDVVISAVTITNERKETMLFSNPYIKNYQSVVLRSDSDLKINGFTDLDGLTVAVQKETTSDILISDYNDTGSIKCTIVPNEKVVSCFTQLENGEIDAVVVDSTVADGYLAANPDKFVKAFQDDSEPEEFGVAMGLKNTALQAAINDAVAELESEGFFDDNVEIWFGSAE